MIEHRILEFSLSAAVTHQAPASLPSAAPPLHAIPVLGPSVWPLQNIGAAATTSLTDKPGPEIGQAHTIAPALSIDDNRVRATVVTAADAQPAGTVV